MPDGVRNGIADKTSDTNFLSDDEEEEEGDSNGGVGVTMPLTTTLPPISATPSENDKLTPGSGRNSRNKNKATLLPLSPLSLPHPHPPQSSLNFFDLLKTGAMVGEKLEKNGNPVPTAPTPAPNTNSNSGRLRLASGPRDSDYVILVLNQKQREDNEVNMLIDRLRENGVSCLFMKNGTNINSSVPCPKSPTPLVTPLVSQPEELQVTRSRRSCSRSRSPFRPLVESSIFLPSINTNSNSPEKVQNPHLLANGKNSCDCLQKCNGVCGGTIKKISTSSSSSKSTDRHSIDTDSVFKGLKEKLLESEPLVCATMLNKKISGPPLILRLPIPSLKIGATPPTPPTVLLESKSSGLLGLEVDQDLQTSKFPPTTKNASSGEEGGNKKKRKRRRKYPYMVRKTVKKRKLSPKKEVIDELTPTEEDGRDELSPRITNPSCSPLIIPSLPLKSFTKPVRVQKSKPKPKPKIRIKLQPQPGRGRPKKSLISQITATLSPKHTSKSGKANGLSPTGKGKSQQSSPSSSSPLLHSPHSNSDDPYVFIPDDGDDFESPPPIKLFSPKSVRKNGLCSPSNGLVVGIPTFSPTSTNTGNLLTVPTWPPVSRKLSPRTVTPEVQSLQFSTPSFKLNSIPMTKPSPPQSEEPFSSPTNSGPEIKAVALPVPDVLEADSSLEVKKKAKRKKRTNEVSQLLTWAISPRPSTPRSTLSMAFLSKDNVYKDKDKVTGQQTSATAIETPSPTEILPSAAENAKDDTTKSDEIIVIENKSVQNQEKVILEHFSEPTKITQTEIIPEKMSQNICSHPEIEKEHKLFPDQQPELEIQPIDLTSTTTPLHTEHPTKSENVAEMEIKPTPQLPSTSLPSVIEASVGKITKNMKNTKAVKRKRKARSALYYKGKKSRVQNIKKSVQIEEISEFVEGEKIQRGESPGCENETEQKIDSIKLLEKSDTDSKLRPSDHSKDAGTKSVSSEIAKSLRTEKAANLEKVLKKVVISARESKLVELFNQAPSETGVETEDAVSSTSAPSRPNDDLSPGSLPTKTLPPSPSPPKPSKNEDIFKIPAIPEPPSSSSTPATSLSVTPSSTPTIPNSFLDAMQLRRPSFYALIAGNVRNNMENFLDGRPPSPTSADGVGSSSGSITKFKRRKKPRPRPRNGFLLHHGDNFPEDPEAPYKLHLATQIILKLNKRRSKFKPKEDKGKSLLSYLKLVPKRVSRTSKQNPVNVSSTTSSEDPTNSKQEHVQKTEDQITSVFSGEWVQPRNFVCNICGQVETDFWDMVHHKGEIHPGIVVTHVELPELPPIGFRGSPTIPTACASTSAVPSCTKCGAIFSSYPDLHLHIFECSGNTTWLNALKEEEAQPQRKKKSKRKRGFNRFKRRLSNTPKKSCSKLKIESSPQKRRTIEMFKCELEFCTREFKTEGWLKNHLATHSLPISIPLDKLKLKQSLPARASSLNMGRRSVVQNLLANGSFKTVT